MTTNKNLYLFAAALVAGTMGMTSCSNEVVPEVENNPTFDGESVKTQFALNIPAAKGTRMSGTNTQQADNSFLGMQNIKLLPLFDTAAKGLALKQIIPLADIAIGGWNNGDNSKIYSDVNIPVGTKSFLFYAEATGTKSADNMAAGQDAFDQGYLENTLNNNNLATVGDITFNLRPVTEGKGFSTSATEATAIINALKSVATDAWKNYAAGKTEGQDAFADLYKKLVKLKAGSANSVKLVLSDLKTELDKLPGNDAYNATLGAVKTAVAQALSDLNSNTFPQNYNLPDGAVELVWAENVPSYKTESAVIGNMTLKPENICYPASLTYFVNTPLKSTTDKTITWPNGTTNWGTALWSGWGDQVTAQTTGIALKNVINYAVANLVTTVKCKYSVLEDNAKNMANEPANRKVIVPTQGFTVTGILVGGQPNSVDWQLLPATDRNRDMMVYDKSIVSGMAATTTKSSENYTLVLDNRKITSTGLNNADDVYIAVEFTNTTGTDFYGADGLVKAGATFYMVAKLDADAAVGVSNSDSRKSVFEQDYKTIANLTIGSLANAYNCIPDLRSTQLQLGLAVDLSWQAGITFDVEFN
ncbi:hypothetical protein QUW02_00690 [Bacteroides eggerthii]|uniref:Lipoprotein n=1 Tax=Bacteroides eggerthii TaxID=28111 RepID=A0ABT7U2G4_9BACE|nr:hypothetical protein [Bacteroides eggerthii]